MASVTTFKDSVAEVGRCGLKCAGTSRTQKNIKKANGFSVKVFQIFTDDEIMKSHSSILALIVDVLRRRNDEPYEKEYLGYESYPSTHLSTIKVPTVSGPSDTQQRKAA